MAPIPVPVSAPNDVSARTRVVNFSAGPSQLPEDVLKKAQGEFLSFGDTGCNVMELSHRGADFKGIITEAEQLMRQLLQVPTNYRILFMQGGGCGQFAAIPMNFLGRQGSEGVADYIVTGRWSESAAKEAEKYCQVHRVLPKSNAGGIPPLEQWNFSSNPDYVYFCDNETVDGVEFLDIPEPPAGVPLVADMSSNLLSRHFDISRFGMIFAGAQKNMGPAGLTVVIIREDLLGNALPFCPSVLNYQVQNKNASMYNTPPTYGIYITGLVLRWVRENGGVERMSEWSDQKSGMMYDLIDSSNGFYSCPVNPSCRSRVNIVFRLGAGEAAEKQFAKEAKELGLVNLEGHRSVGGLRASLYNAVSVSDTQRLLQFMRDFALRHGKKL